MKADKSEKSPVYKNYLIITVNYHYMYMYVQCLDRGSVEWTQVMRRHRNAIVHSCRADFRNFVEGLTARIGSADEKGNAAEISRGVSALVKLGRCHVVKQPARNSEGVVFASPEELAEAWAVVAEAKFAATDREAGRDPLSDLGPASSRSADVPTLCDCSKC